MGNTTSKNKKSVSSVKSRPGRAISSTGAEVISGGQIRVVVADDSPFVCKLMQHLLESDSQIRVVGTAHDGLEAIDLVHTLHPNVLTLDLEMPRMKGPDALRRIMEETPVPVILVSAYNRQGAESTVQALEFGAVDFVLKFAPGVPMTLEMIKHELIAKVKAASKVKVIRLLKEAYAPPMNAAGGSTLKTPVIPVLPTLLKPTLLPGRNVGKSETKQMPPAVMPVSTIKVNERRAPVPPAHPATELLVIGASTGGPLALRELLSQLPENYPLGVLVVQHMPPRFTAELAAHLDRTVAVTVSEARAGELVLAGHVYIAPGDYHMIVTRQGRLELNQQAEVNGHRPSVDIMMMSAAESYEHKVTAVILTGMGEDGVRGMKAIYLKGGATLAQSAKTCVVDGMPGRALEFGIVDFVASPPEIGLELVTRIKRR